MSKQDMTLLVEGIRSRVTQIRQGVIDNPADLQIGENADAETVLKATKLMLDDIISELTSQSILGYKHPTIARKMLGLKDPTTLAFEMAIKENAETMEHLSKINQVEKEKEQVEQAKERQRNQKNQYIIKNTEGRY